MPYRCHARAKVFEGKAPWQRIYICYCTSYLTITLLALLVPDKLRRKWQCSSEKTNDGSGEWTRKGQERFVELLGLVCADRALVGIDDLYGERADCPAATKKRKKRKCREEAVQESAAGKKQRREEAIRASVPEDMRAVL